MFLIPCVFLGVVLAVLLGGRLGRLLEVRIRLPSLIFAALALQIGLFSRLTEGMDDTWRAGLHMGSYGLLAVFAVVNLRIWALTPVLVGMFMNAAAIVANGGKMPMSEVAARAVGVEGRISNVSADADRLAFLGDVFALPSPLPLANVFSIGDVFIGFGMAIFIVAVSLRDGGEPSLHPRRLAQPLRLPAYRLLLVGKFVSQIGDWVTLAALVGWLYSQTQSTVHVAALLLLRLAPPILGGGIAIMLVDRVPKRALLVSVELARGVVVSSALVGVILEATPLVYVSLALSGALAALGAPAVPALIPSVVPDEQLQAANAGLGMTKDAAMAIGAFSAGIALSVTGVAAALVVDLVTFALAAALFSRVHVGDSGRASDEREERTQGAFRYVLHRRRLVVLIFSFATATLATGLTNATLPQFLDGDLSLGPAAYGFGIAAIATGLFIGEALVGFSRVSETAGRWIGCGLFVMAGLLGLLGMVEHGPTALLLLVAIGFVDGTTDVLFETTAQREANPRYYGAVFGVASTMMAATMTGAFLAAPILNELLDASAVLLAAAGFLAVAGAIALIGMRAPGARAGLDIAANDDPSSVALLGEAHSPLTARASAHSPRAAIHAIAPKPPTDRRPAPDVQIVASEALAATAMQLAWGIPTPLTVEVMILAPGARPPAHAYLPRIAVMLVEKDDAAAAVPALVERVAALASR